MKFFKPRPPKDRSEAMVCACMNLLATPGLGMVVAARYSCGIPQFLLAVTGFFLIIWWFIQKMRVFYDQIDNPTLPLDLGNTAGLVGVSVFAIAWIWSLVTSISLVKSAGTREPANQPPKLF